MTDQSELKEHGGLCRAALPAVVRGAAAAWQELLEMQHLSTCAGTECQALRAQQGGRGMALTRSLSLGR